jgi:hypothetical protein
VSHVLFHFVSRLFCAPASPLFSFCHGVAKCVVSLHFITMKCLKTSFMVGAELKHSAALATEWTQLL